VRLKPDDPKLAVRAFGLNFPNPIGMAAGFDKSGEVPDALLRLGFGFVEIGSVTPKPQIGNPRPRIFRLERDEGVVNRMGFNNDGAKRCCGGSPRAPISAASSASMSGPTRIRRSRRRLRQADRDFCAGRELFHHQRVSPNTPGLRNLQQSAALDDLLAKVIDARERVRKHAGDSPVLLKGRAGLEPRRTRRRRHIARSRRVDGMIVANTTLARPRRCARPTARRKTRAVGRPLFRLSTAWWRKPMCARKARFP